MSFKTDRARFMRPHSSPTGAKFARDNMANYFHGQAAIAACAGDLAEQAAFIEAAEDARTMSPSLGPPVPIAGAPPSPPASPEEP